jgi:uncharacterized membrane protein (DUF485 family)
MGNPMLTKYSLVCSVLLVAVNIAFLYVLVTEKVWVSLSLIPGLTVGIVAFGAIILFAVILTWVYVLLINTRKTRR